MHIDIHAFNVFRTHDASIQATEDISCLRQRGHCDRLRTYFSRSNYGFMARWRSIAFRSGGRIKTSIFFPYFGSTTPSQLQQEIYPPPKDSHSLLVPRLRIIGYLLQFVGFTFHVILSIYLSMVLQFFVRPWPLFYFLYLVHRR
jgi:hypothetical protein